MRKRLQPFVRLLVAGAVVAGCAASQTDTVDYDSCERACASESASCKATCLKMTDPTGRISGSTESCERSCSTDFALCDLQCVKARGQAAP